MRVFLLFIFFTLQLSANVFQLSTVVDDQQLVPVIKINGQIVIEVKDVGSKSVYSSSFERSEKIFNTLKDLEKKTSDLNRIRIRRSPNKSDYVAYVDNVELYRVTPSDVIGSDLTVYQKASEWRDNIYNALKTIVAIEANGTDEDGSGLNPFPLIGFLSIFSNNSFLTMMLQLSLFICIQVLAILLTFNYLNRRNKYVFEEFQKRLKKFHHKQIQTTNLISSLETQVQDLNSKLDLNKPGNISKLN